QDLVQRKIQRSRRRRPVSPPRRRPDFDVLENRVLLTWTAVGPAPINSGTTNLTPGNDPISGRVTGIAAHPTKADTVYVATAGGGVWKTINATASNPSWTPLTDQAIVSFTGAVALAPKDPDNTLFAGTGESNFSFDSYYGGGVLKSTNAGGAF